jgi:hypothetical protein
MTRIPVALATGRTVEFEIRQGSDGPSLFLFSVRKCGSTIFNNIAHAMAKANNCHYVDIGDTFFRANVLPRDYCNDEGLPAILHRGNVYGGFRDMPHALWPSPLFCDGPKLLMVRDPRDALVSLYYSNAYSHPIPQSTGEHDEVAQHMERQRAIALGTPLDKYVIQYARGMKHSMMQYRALMQNTRTTLLKYEDYILNKGALMRIIAEKFGWQADDELISETLKWADIRPEAERPTEFIRKVTPGDHQEKLSTATIAALNEILMPVFELFRYSC